jgi:hypothetical protein
MKKIYKKSVPTVYRGIRYRSRWEIYCAKLLLYSGISFQYEPQRFFLTNTLSALPDFFLPSLNLYLEVKGAYSKKDYAIKAILSRTHNIKYLGKKELEFISGRKASFLSSKEIVNYKPTQEEVLRFKKLLEY